LAIVAAVRAASKNERWGFLTFEGIAGIVAGIIAMALPGLTVSVFFGILAAPNASLDIHPPGRQSKPTIIRATKLHNASVIRSAFVNVLEHGKVSDNLFAILPHRKRVSHD
jgi:hypothetical protein